MLLGDVEPCELEQRLQQQWGAARQLASDLQSSVAGYLAASVQPPSLSDLGLHSSTASDRVCDATCSRDNASDGAERRDEDRARLREAAMARLRGFRWQAQVILQQSTVLADVTFHLCDFFEASSSLSPEELSRLAAESSLLQLFEASSNLPSDEDSSRLLSSSACSVEGAREVARVTVAGSGEGGGAEDPGESEWDAPKAGVEEAVGEEPAEMAEGEDGQL
ncbi:hypothetical protein CLOP_g9589 [Closterium sp. NIES-67]|nr:hypothetical protein CLOP_g9589 [Closterium sp. NIES-67]